MTIDSALKIAKAFDFNAPASEDDIFEFTEAMNFLIAETKEPRYMMHLGSYYYETKHFDLAQKYYEMAETYGSTDAYVCLGFVWYYGRTGSVDYEKAFHYFSKAADLGDLEAAHKVADMYLNGYYVEKDYEKYKEIIESLYPRVEHARYLNEQFPETAVRLARIRAEDGKTEEAVTLYQKAKWFLAQRIRVSRFFGNFTVMKWIIDELYNLIPFDEESFDFYDLFHLLKTPQKVKFCYQGIPHYIETVMENEECVIHFDEKWYRTREDFFLKAEIDGIYLTEIYQSLSLFEVLPWN